MTAHFRVITAPTRYRGRFWGYELEIYHVQTETDPGIDIGIDTRIDTQPNGTIGRPRMRYVGTTAMSATRRELDVARARELVVEYLRLCDDPYGHDGVAPSDVTLLQEVTT